MKRSLVVGMMILVFLVAGLHLALNPLSWACRPAGIRSFVPGEREGIFQETGC